MAGNSEKDVREEARRLLSGGMVELVVGYGPGHAGAGVRPAFARTPLEAQELVYNEDCVHNLAVYISREPCRRIILRGGRIGIVAKGCDARAISVLIQEGQVARDSLCIIGVVCEGVRDARAGAGGGTAPKCRVCEVETPPLYDTLIGSAGTLLRERGVEGDIEELCSMSRPERWDFWKGHLTGCLKCYACREACPMCYCEECITEKSRPQWIDKPSHLRGVLAYHMTRAMHLAGRCVSCGECGRACPVDIPVDRISRYMAGQVKEVFGYAAGMDPESAPVFTTHSEDDPGDFIK